MDEVKEAVKSKYGMEIGKETRETLENIPWKKIGIATAVGVTSVYIGAPLVVYGLGFKATGIASTSVAAKIMSTVAIANGGGVPATSVIAALQSAGVLGISTKTSLIIGGAFGGATFLTGSVVEGKNDLTNEKETRCMEMVNNEMESKSNEYEARDVSSNSTSSTYSTVESQYKKAGDLITGAASNTYSAVKTAGNLTYDLMKSSSGLITAETNVADVANDKKDPKSSYYQSIMTGASDVVTGTSSYISRVVKMSTSLLSREPVKDVKKEE